MRRRDDDGQTLVEFALILPIFVLVLVGLFDVGRAVFAYSTVNNAAREAGRVAIVDQTPAHVRQEAAQQAATLGIPASAVTISYRNHDDTGPCPSLTAPPVGCLAVIGVPYTYDAATPIVSQLMGTITLTGKTVFPIEAACVEPAAAKCPKGS